MVITDDVKRRFYSKVDVNMQWIGSKIPDGYGMIQVNRKSMLAHRLSYEIHNGEIPEGMCVLHSCDDPGCVHPDHLHLGTQKDNARERSERKRYGDVRGENNGRSKLTLKDVEEIRHRYEDGETQCNLAKEYGVNQGRISSIVLRQSWSHV